MKRKPLVFVIPTSYPSDDNPVANSFIQEQVKAISVYDCDVVVLNVQKQPTKQFMSRINADIRHENDGISDVLRTKCKTLMESKLPFINQILFRKSLRKVYLEAIRNYGLPDVIFAHFYKATAAIQDVIVNRQIPVVSMEHSGELMEKRMNTYNLYLLKKAVNLSSSYICTTQNLKDNVVRLVNPNKEIFIIPNVVDSRFTFSPLNSDKFIFFSLARLEYDKRVDLLVDAFCTAFSENDNVELRIGGTGPEYNSIQAMIKGKKRECDITLLGRLDRTQVVNEMRNATSFVLPSRHETFGLVWREALCSGRPVITTNHGGFSAVDWKSSYGEMIDVDSKEQLVESLLNVKKEFARYNLKEISDENIDRYSMEKVGLKIYMMLKNAQ